MQLASADPCDRDAIATEMAQIEEAVTILSTPIPDSPQKPFQGKVNYGEAEVPPSVLMLEPSSDL